jgi:hypothetical protein
LYGVLIPKQFYHSRAPDAYAERVQNEFAKIQLFEFTAARIISLKAGGALNFIPCFSLNDFTICRKYGNTIFHHASTRRIDWLSHGTSVFLLSIIFSMVSAQ